MNFLYYCNVKQQQQQQLNSLHINLDVQGEQIAFFYEHSIVDDKWSAVIVDECGTIKQPLSKSTAAECLDALIPFLNQLGKVTSVTSTEPNCPYKLQLQNKLMQN